ncbi:MAG: caspase family protein [Elusimicrobia bacterium]|nr:caspase family protein [Elusimicrobiota bacterium]
MRSLAHLPLLLILLAGCASVVARKSVGAAVPRPTYNEARRQAIALLKQARLETEDSTVPTVNGMTNFSVNEKGIVLSYNRFQNLLDNVGLPVQTSCEYDYLDDLVVVEYSGKYWQWCVPLGRTCERLALYFESEELASQFARSLAALKSIAAEPPAAAGAAAPAPRKEAPVSDVDKPSYKLAERPGDYAIVVGIGKYSDIPEAMFAERDAEAVRDHLIAEGFPSRNVVFLSGERAGYKGIEKFVETWLPKNVGQDGRVFFYFSGHGAPDPKTGQAYLIPYDGDPNYLENTGYPLGRLYAKLSALKAKEVIVALDSCFSGAGGRSVMAKGARPLVTKVDAMPAQKNLTVFAAASADQITSTLDDQGHGTFTYYFLKGLGGNAKDASGRVTAQALYDYLKPKVQDAARRQNREQEPALHGRADSELVRF